MKHLFRIMMCTAIAGALVSCERKEIEAPEAADLVVPEGYHVQEFRAISSDTRTSLDDNGSTVWSADDRITVFWDSGNCSADCVSGEDSGTATFRAIIPDGTTVIYAAYPEAINAEVSVATEEIEVEIGSEQPGSFSAGNIAVAKANGDMLNFFNVNAFLCFEIPGDDITKVVAESVSGAALAGKQVVSFAGETPALGAQSDPSSSITMSVNGSGKYYMSILPGVQHESGLLLKYYKGDDVSGTYYLDKDITTVRNKIYAFGEFEPDGNYYATPDGAGNKSGLNWDNAMDAEKLSALLTIPSEAAPLAAKVAALDGATIHLGAGTFDLGDLADIDFSAAESAVTLNFVGNTPVSGNDDSWTVITGAEDHRIISLSDKVKATFTDISFEKGVSHASGNAPVLICAGAEATFTNCRFLDGYNIKDDGVNYSTGGGVYAQEDTKVSFTGCEFARNKASYAASLAIKGEASIDNCNFHDNKGTNMGSAIYVDYGVAVCDVKNSVISSNSVANVDGGAIVVSRGTITLTSCTIEENYGAKRGSALRLVNSDSFGTLINCTVKGNSAAYGGAINVPKGVCTIEGGTYEANYSTSTSGGCILSSGSGEVSVKDAVFKKNYVVNFGGAIRHESNGALTIINTKFEGNYSTYDGENEAFGAAVSIDYGQKDAKVTIDGCSFIGNHAKSGGASALSYQSSGDGATGWMKVSNTLFEGNYNEYAGTNNNNYARHAGAVRLGHDSTNSYFDNCVFKDNYTKAANAEMKSCYGGAVSFYSDGNGYFNNCHFENNHATRGGAISSWGCTGSGIYLNGCSFSGNWCSYKFGTTIFVSRTQRFCMNNCSFNDNTYSLSTDGDNACWVYVDGNAASGDASPNNTKLLDECVISNCSIIGSARASSSLTPLTNGQELVYILDLKSGGKCSMINNAIIAEGTEQYSWWFNSANISGYNNVCTQAGSSCTSSCTYTPSGDTSGKSKSDFGSLAWDSADNVWKWNGTLAGGCTAISASDFATAVESGSASFKAWLEEKGVLNKDQLGNDRGSGDWWPGAYQK